MLLDVRVLAAVAVLVALLAVLAARRPDLLVPAGAAGGVLLCRPSAVGERVPALGPAVLVLVAVAAVAPALRHRTRDHVPPWPLLLIALAWAWLGCHRLLAPGSEPNLVTSTITVLVPVLAFYPVVREPAVLARTRTVLVGAVTVVSALTVVAVLLVLPAGPTATLVGTAPLGYAGGGAPAYLPGALAYGLDPGTLVPRMLGVGREPGMGALVIGWAYFALRGRHRLTPVARVVLVLALLATQSTAGIGIFGVCLLLQAVAGRARFSPTAVGLAVVGGAATVYLAVFSPAFGLLSKADPDGASGASFASRNRATLDGWHALTAHPFTAYSDAPLSSINLVAAVAVDGLPWAVLAGGFLLAPVLRTRRRDPLRYGALFVLLVMLTSQPLAGNAGVLLLAMATYYAARSPVDGSVPAPTGGTVPSPAGGTVPGPAGGTVPIPAGGPLPAPAADPAPDRARLPAVPR